MAGIATSVIPLLSQWEKYSTEHPAGDIPGFARWILAQQPDQPPPPTSTHLEKTPVTARIGLLIDRLHSVIRVFTKPIIKSLGFAKEMEFTVLVHVAMMKHPNKKTICDHLLIENSTGVEITKRLAQRGLITEEPDPNDRRSARLSITDKGMEILFQADAPYKELRNTFFNALDAEEREQLATLLGRINDYHTNRLNSEASSLLS